MFHTGPCGRIRICRGNPHSGRQACSHRHLELIFSPRKRSGPLDRLPLVCRHVGFHCTVLQYNRGCMLCNHFRYLRLMLSLPGVQCVLSLTKDNTFHFDTFPNVPWQVRYHLKNIWLMSCLFPLPLLSFLGNKLPKKGICFIWLIYTICWKTYELIVSPKSEPNVSSYLSYTEEIQVPLTDQKHQICQVLHHKCSYISKCDFTQKAVQDEILMGI